MAANNYFGFTHGGTQYSAQATAPYPAAAQPAAYVQPAQTAYATPARPQTYDTYQTAPAAGQYTYTTRTQVPQPTPTYDTAKTYYTPTAAPAAATAVYTVAEPAYQTPKPAYTSNTYTQHTTQRAVPVSKPVVSQSAASSSYVYQTPAVTSSVTGNTYHVTTSNVNASSTTASKPYAGKGYDAAVYSAATNYYQQQQNKTTPGVTSSNWVQKKTFPQKPKTKPPPKQSQLHYCEVCKISCAGPQTYREHLEGQKHKKKEQAAKQTPVTSSSSVIRGQAQLRCELCDVSCTGADAYAAHIRGAKHQKVLKLHTRLGKPIPSEQPVVVGSGSGSSTTPTTTAAKSSPATSAAPAKAALVAAKPAVTPASNPARKIVATPKITFVGGAKLQSTGAKLEEVKTEPVKTPEPIVEDKLDPADLLLPGEKDVQPVGQEYIEEVRNEFGNVVSFHCKLCECKFNDPNAKIMHMKGRRHRLQYKKKVDPSLQVEVKPSIRARKLQEERLRRQAAKEEYWRRRDAEARWRMEWEQRQYEEEMLRWQGQGRGVPFGPGGPGAPGHMAMRRPDTSDDRHVMAKHAAIYPTEQELQAVQNIVSTCEKSLKLVSDHLAISDGPKTTETVIKKEVKDEKDDEKKDGEKEQPTTPPTLRALKGVMRVGVLAKGLLLHTDLNVNLVVLCTEKPTRSLLERVADNLPKQLSTVTEDKYEVKMCVEEAAVIVVTEKDPKTSCTITLTSPIMREEANADGGHDLLVVEGVQTKAEPPDVLDRQKCLDALAALRHAKWFQARANGLQSCVVVIRILRDLCQRVPTWTPLNQWAMELLVEKCVSSGGQNMSPGDAFRRVFECIASGILLPGGPGLYDPCEKEGMDAASTLTNQEREDITASAQHALRLIAFRQIHKVLGMDQLPAPRFQKDKRTNRKRRHTNSTSEGNEEAAEGKKDKKDGDGEGMETSGGH